MSFETKRAKNKLSNRLTRVYAALFSLIFFVLSAFVFLLAYRFLVQKQQIHLISTAELIGENLVEEMEEIEESEESEELSGSELLEKLNTDPNLSIFVFNSDGKLVNRELNFPLPDNFWQKSGDSPAPFFHNNTLMLRVSRPMSDYERNYGSLTLVYSMTNETTFLKLLGLLLLGANIAGVVISLLVSQKVSRRILSPIGQMISAANRIDHATLSARLEVPEPDDELRHLALTLNGMLDRVSSAYHQQGRFVADVSHELRTPLAVMQGNVDLLSRWGAEDPAVRDDSIRALGNQTTYMNALVENLLFLARSDNAQFRLNRTTFPVDALFAELLEEQALLDPAHTYAQTLAPQDGCLTADRGMILQLLRALLDNSVKYTPEGGTITLGFEQQENTSKLYVRDSGVGMDTEACNHIFERFYRVDEARARATGGMGLGLSIVLAIAQSHGGSAKAESTPGYGTTITVTLPD